MVAVCLFWLARSLCFSENSKPEKLRGFEAVEIGDVELLFSTPRGQA